jgi:hypothetical protein
MEDVLRRLKLILNSCNDAFLVVHSGSGDSGRSMDVPWFENI